MNEEIMLCVNCEFFEEIGGGWCNKTDRYRHHLDEECEEFIVIEEGNNE